MNYRIFIWVVAIGVLSCKTAQTPVQVEEEDYPVEESVQLLEVDSVDYHPIKEYRRSRSRSMDLLHTKLHVSFDWNKEWVMGEAHLQLKPYFYSQEALLLDAKGFELRQVALIDGLDTLDVEFEYENDQLYVDLGRAYSRNELINIYVNYIAKPSERETQSGTAIEDNKGLYFINSSGDNEFKPKQIWTQGETESNSAWFPTIDAPNERATQEIFITINDSLKTLSNGQLMSSVVEDGMRTDHWKLDKPHAPYLTMIAVGDFEVVQDEVDGIDLSYFVEPAYAPYAKSIFGSTPEMLSYFSELLDYPYPWGKYDQVIVRDFVSGAMENTSASVFMEDLMMTDKELLDQNWDYIIAHELFHHWFGNLVTCESWSHLPLNESFASYGEQLWIDHKYGRDEANYHVLTEKDSYLAESEGTMVPMIRYFYDDPDDMFDNHSYAKGGLILRMLRGYLGDEAFFASLKTYLKTNEFQSVEIHDLRLALEKTTGEDLSWFFNQWFMEPGHPVLEVTHTYQNDTLNLTVKQSQDLELFPLYKLPTYIHIYIGEKLYAYPIIIEDVEEEVSIPVPGEPKLVILDGEFMIVGEIIHEKSFEEYLFQLDSCENLIGRYEAFITLAQSGDLESTVSALEIALSDRSYRLRSLALEFLQSEPDYLVNESVEKLTSELVKDSTSDVRSGALYALSIFDVSKYKEYLNEGLADPAYSVQAVALMGLLELDTGGLANAFAPFLDEVQIDVLLPTADFMNRSKDPNTLSWYQSKFQQLNGTEVFYLLQYFTEFILDATEENKSAAIPILTSFAMQHADYLVRFSSFQILALMSESKSELKEVLQEIIDNEKDERLIEYYNQVQLN